MRIVHKGLRTLYETDRAPGLPQAHVARIRRILADLDVAKRPGDLAMPGYRLHPLKGKQAGRWSVRVSGNWRIVFGFDDGEPIEVDLVDYHQRGALRPTSERRAGGIQNLTRVTTFPDVQED